MQWGLTVAFTPKGGCPLKQIVYTDELDTMAVVAFTPKGGCPLKRGVSLLVDWHFSCSIHPQGWVPIET